MKLKLIEIKMVFLLIQQLRHTQKRRKPDNPHTGKDTKKFSATPIRVTGGKSDSKKMFSK